MSIPLDRLYDHLHNKSNHDMIIYRWLPHGSKKLEDLHCLSDEFHKDWVTSMTTPIVIMHDQEPLDYNLWSNSDFEQAWRYIVSSCSLGPDYLDPIFLQHQVDLHLRSMISPASSLYDKLLLVHSEQNSQQVELYSNNGYIPVYYWSHALLAVDWFRYAEFDPLLRYNINEFKHDFLIYNRAWSGTREYRLFFSEKLVESNLLNCCLTSFSSTDQGHYYTEHQFKNPNLSISTKNLEKYFKPNRHSSSASADYNNLDYNIAAIEVVLETLFDDSRHHITEKTLRPIACGKPFILAATPWSLKYLHDYGFKTFNGLINEDYDTIVDPQQRLNAIIKEMQRISVMPLLEKKELIKELHEIAKFNQALFFSRHWQDSIEAEFYQNLDVAIHDLNTNCTGKHWLKSLTMPKVSGSTNKSPEQIRELTEWLKKKNS